MVLDKCEAYQDAQLLEGFFEHNTPLRTRGRDSQTDLLALVSLKDGLGVIGGEGKVDEPFGQLVKDWNDGSEGKERRLGVLLEVLQIDPGEADALDPVIELLDLRSPGGGDGDTSQELEITDINNLYVREGTLTFSILEGWWTDAGTIDSLVKASELVKKTGANNITTGGPA